MWQADAVAIEEANLAREDTAVELARARKAEAEAVREVAVQRTVHRSLYGGSC